MRSLGSTVRMVAVTLAFSVAVVGCGDDGGSGVDKASYTAGFNDAFGGANVPPADGSREEVEHLCDDLYGKMTGMYGGKEIVREDWVQGCADAAQNKESRFE